MTVPERLEAYLKSVGTWVASGSLQKMDWLNEDGTLASPRTVVRRLEELAEEGILKVEYRDKNHAWYSYGAPVKPVRKIVPVILPDGTRAVREVVETPEVPKVEPRLTERQRRALELYCRQVAEALNGAGYPIQAVLKEKMDIDWSHDTVKELLWKTAQRWITQKESTTQLSKTKEIDVIYEHLNRHLGEKFGVHVAFPHFENEQYEEETSRID